MLRISKNKISKYDGTEFFDNRRKKYKDRATKPLFRNNSVSYNNRNYLLKTLPFDETGSRRQPKFNRVYSPFITSADPLWLTGVNEGCWNQRYGPFAAIYFIIRDHFRDFYSLVDGKVISSQEDFEEVKEDFNNVWRRILSGKGNGASKGCCSVSEMIRLGSLFYILQKSSQRNEGIAINNDKEYNGNWCGREVVFDLDKQTFKQYRKKLEDVYFSDLTFEKFMMRYIPSSTEDSLWYFPLPDLYSDSYSNKIQKIDNFDWFDIHSLSKLFDFISPINNRNSYILIFFRHSEELYNAVKDMFPSTMKLTDTSIVCGEDFYLHRKLGSVPNEYSALTNYSISNDLLA